MHLYLSPLSICLEFKEFKFFQMNNTCIHMTFYPQYPIVLFKSSCRSPVITSKEQNHPAQWHFHINGHGVVFLALESTSVYILVVTGVIVQPPVPTFRNKETRILIWKIYATSKLNLEDAKGRSSAEQTEINENIGKFKSNIKMVVPKWGGRNHRICWKTALGHLGYAKLYLEIFGRTCAL